MATNNTWIIITVTAIWLAVLISSLFSPDLVFGSEPVEIRVGAIIDWFWGLLGTVFVLRSTAFRRPTEAGWGQDAAWPWIAAVVGGVWAAATIVSVASPALGISDSIEIPAAAILAPPAAAALTWYAAEFLIAGFAARRGDAFD